MLERPVQPSLSEMQEALRSVVGSRTFRNSHAATRLLRYLCNGVLVGDANQITEYTVAVDVFGKESDFKETKDATVRVEVHRLRKRLRQFYESEGATHSIRIVIPTGKYIPDFVCSEEQAEDTFKTAELAPTPEDVPRIAASQEKPRIRYRQITAALVIFSAIALVFGFFYQHDHAGGSGALETFWAPILASPRPVLVCFGNVAGDQTLVPLNDATTLGRLTGWLGEKHKLFRIASQSTSDYAEMRNDPSLQIGFSNNDRTNQLAGGLRFVVDRSTSGKLAIRDRQIPARDEWLSSDDRDYALIVRVGDGKSGEALVLVGGLSSAGTLAAGEFLTSAAEMRQLATMAPDDWKSKNIELVISTEISKGQPGPAKIEADWFW